MKKTSLMLTGLLAAVSATALAPAAYAMGKKDKAAQEDAAAPCAGACKGAAPCAGACKGAAPCAGACKGAAPCHGAAPCKGH